MEIVIRATVIYWVLWLIVRGSGKKALAELSPLELILVVVMGDFVQQGVTQEDMSITGAALAVGTFTAWALATAGIAGRWRFTGRVLQGRPVVVVTDGNVDVEALRSQHLSLDDLREAAREQGIAHLGSVWVAVAEPDGKFSFVRDEPAG
jgi:uncharacterized membrane protein YcaP (DUF421 family)